MWVLVTRPREDGEETVLLLAALGHEGISAPLLEVNFHDGAELPLDGVQAILATSANGIRALARRSARRDVPIFAVGPQTAEAARQAGFAQVKNADGDAKALAAATARWAEPAAGALLHVCGAQGESVLADLLRPQGFTIRKAVLYNVAAADALPPDAAKALRDGALDAALFFSPRSAAVFQGCVARENLGGACGGLLAICISAATAKKLEPLSFRAVRIAESPNQESLLACLA
ncbi:MAG TPA: uroporphyrinogen-III synthase [Rhizomicrobium sp.]